MLNLMQALKNDMVKRIISQDLTKNIKNDNENIFDKKYGFCLEIENVLKIVQ